VEVVIIDKVDRGLNYGVLCDFYPFIFSPMKVTIITAVYNGQEHIASCIESVLSQDYPHIEYIIVDGASKDSTLEIVKSYGSRIAQVISEPDRGMYDAMNKGLKLATGDIVGILNSDDFYVNNHIVSQVVSKFEETKADSLYADIAFVSKENLEKVLRYYSSASFKPWKFRFGYMPAHPSFFLKRSMYMQHGLFKPDFKLCADFDLLVRLYHVHKISAVYLPQMVVKMRMGGKSNQSLQNVMLLNREILRGCLENGIKTNLIFIYIKYFTKVFELLKKSK
jgi:glycosyltransferase involved in cell wall biosynthesis